MRFNAKRLFEYVLVFLLAASAGFLCAENMQKEHGDEPLSVSADAYVQPENSTPEQFRTERQQLRSMQKAQLNEIIFSGADADTVDLAQRQLMDILTREEQENTLEGLLEIRGFQDAVVSVHRDSVSVLICADVLTQQESGVILDLVCRETGFLSGNIKIIPVN